MLWTVSYNYSLIIRSPEILKCPVYQNVDLRQRFVGKGNRISRSTRGSFYEQLIGRNSNPMEIWFSDNSIVGKHIATQFCACQTAVEPCAKFWSNHSTATWITAERIFHRIGIRWKKTFLKWVPGLHAPSHRVYLYIIRTLFFYKVLICCCWIISSYKNHGFCLSNIPWWHHQMETFFALLVLCDRNPHRSLLDSPHKCQWCGALVFFIRLNKRLGKQLRRRRFETPSR